MDSHELFSIRLVIADFYMEKPKYGLDPCYSEFRGREIKKVPIIRVFGANSRGQKTCMHIHGVFPYFYVPYESKQFESLEKAIYQIALGVDKAINISLGQGSSNAQHVFKIQLVKGIPFYGYHRTEHQFLKIYMFNPRFVRRAATMLQNGVVMGKNFHPHESHVPYILQFMIDYNLYGMSFLHVPFEVVKFRRHDEEELVPYANVKIPQILKAETAAKQSSSALEVDIGCNFIINRFQLMVKSDNSNSNPGIESIWQDERLRRQKLATSFADDQEKLDTIPPLEVPPTQERPAAGVAESEIFYRTGLLAKLLSMDNSIAESGNLTENILSGTLVPNPITPKEQRRTFNLKKLVGNAIYPEECSQEQRAGTTDASFIENHLSNRSIFQMSILGPNSTERETDADANATLESENLFSNETIVDEDLITQQQHVPLDATLREEDLQLLEVLQELEEGGDNPEQIDLDSTLAPLSQPDHDQQNSPEQAAVASRVHLNQSLHDDACEAGPEGEEDAHDFTMVMDDIDDLLLKLSQSRPPELAIPQVDGSDDLLLRTPPKRGTRSLHRDMRTLTPKSSRASSGQKSPARSPKTPKSKFASRYRPLPHLIAGLSDRKVTPSTRNCNRTDPEGPASSHKFPLHRNVALLGMGMRRNSIASVLELNKAGGRATPILDREKHINTRPLLRRVRNVEDLEKTHITCALTPRRRSERLLRVYNCDEGARERVSKSREGMQVDEAASTPVRLAKVPTRRSPRLNEASMDGRVSTKSQFKVRKLAVRLKRLDLPKPAPQLVPASDPPAGDQGPEAEGTRTNAGNKTPVETEEDGALGCVADKPDKRSSAELPLPMGDDDSEEVAPSDTEADDSTLRLRKTPNLKRLHRSLRSISLSLQRRRLQDSSAAAQSPRSNAPSSAGIPSNPGTGHVSPKPVPYPLAEPHALSVPELEPEPEAEDAEDDPRIQSFYERSLSPNSPSLFSNASSPAISLLGNRTPIAAKNSPLPQNLNVSEASKPSGEDLALITPMCLPPSYEEVAEGCTKLGIPEFVFPRPHYSNPDDLSKQREVGFLVLQIPGNKLNDCEEFQSVLGADLKGLNAWRRRKLAQIAGPEALSRQRGVKSVREYLATNRSVLVEPLMRLPDPHEVRVWLKARDLLKAKNPMGGEEAQPCLPDADSPIKVRRQKVAMILNECGGSDGDADGDGDADTSLFHLTLTPVTPHLTPEHGREQAQPVEGDASLAETPLSTKTESLARSERKRQQKRRSGRARMSLNKELLSVAMLEKSLKDRHQVKVKPMKNLLASSGGESSLSPSSLRSSQSSDTSVGSDLVLAQLERSSFLRNLPGSQPSESRSHNDSFGLSAATLDNTFGFKVNLENLQQAKSDIEYNYLTTVALEVFVSTREELHPDPRHDPIRCIFYAIENSIPAATEDEPNNLPTKACGYIIVNDEEVDVVKEGKIHGLHPDIGATVVSSELAALHELLALCRHWDPDIFAGYEIEMSSWGYIFDRAKQLSVDLAPLLSRVPSQKVRDFFDDEREQLTDLEVDTKLCGRILLDVWRLMRSEIALTSYTFENVMYHIMHKRCPWHSYQDLTRWFRSPCSRWIVLEYYLERVRGTLALFEQLDLIGRTSEMAKLIGIQFYEVLSRGSQFRVESMMLRIAKPRNLVPLSPSVQQRAHMRAPEYLPLILEPQSRFYADPLIVLDFQSLYPSMIIAYNYCFSTCLGRVEHLGSSAPFEFGAAQLRVSPTLLQQLIDRDLVTISPCGVVFVKACVREGILPRMLTEILETRQMVKQSMKLHKSSSALQRILHSRQLGLKLMANVTYGYTAANFSGRMPSVEVGDSVVSKGREALEMAIKMVEANAKWNAKVVYGDTDSLFVLVPGRNREQAFKIGEQIAEAVTRINPHPVKLKLEKVYQPCILQTKKRYVGYMYESADQAEPVYEAKGIETVRRDGCPAVAKMLEKVLRILFESADVSRVKQYVCRQFTKLLSGRANLQDLIFAKEFRGLNGYKPTACVPALEMTRKWIQSDPRRIPRRGERVPFIVTNGPPGVPLIRLVRHPHELLSNEGLKINAIYYITKAIIPPLNRCLLLIGADVNEWFANLPRKVLMTPALSVANELAPLKSNAGNLVKKSTISQYFSTTNCVVDCGRQTKHGICSECNQNNVKVMAVLQTKISKIERGYHLTQQICQACCGRVGDINCGSLDCPVLYVMEVKRRELPQITYLRNLLAEKF